MKAKASLRQWFDGFQRRIEPAAESAVRVILIDLVSGAFSERVQGIDHICWIGQVVCRLSECALKVQQAFPCEKANHFA